MYAMAAQECARVDSARVWQDGALEVNFRTVLSQVKGARGRMVFELRVGRKFARRSGMLMFGG
jgi:hypothetical protein